MYDLLTNESVYIYINRFSPPAIKIMNKAMKVTEIKCLWTAVYSEVRNNVTVFRIPSMTVIRPRF